MDTSQVLADAARRYLDGDISLHELLRIEAAQVHRLPQLPRDSLAVRLIGALTQGMAFIYDGVGTEEDLRQSLQAELRTPDIPPRPANNGRRTVAVSP